MARSKRRFGSVRQLRSGRWQARYSTDGVLLRTAPHTFETKTNALCWLTELEAEILRGQWIDPDAGKLPFRAYADEWLRERQLRPKSRQLYEGLLRLHLYPTFGEMPIGDIRERHVRRWRAQLLDDGPGASTVAKAYRLLRSIMGTAVEDELIRRNPCRIKGAGVERPDERPILTVAQVFALADAMAPRYRALVLLATFASMRWGELAALRRHCVDLDARVIRIEASLAELKDGSLVTGRPKSDAGVRRVVIPSVIVDDLRWHLQRFAGQEPDGLVFVGEHGAQLRRSNFSRKWNKARDALGMPDLHFHDLRHTGNTLAAVTGAHLRELMERMGHSSTKAAMGYLHSTDERAKAIADALGALVERERKATGDPDDHGDDPPLADARR
jgi:integrase